MFPPISSPNRTISGNVIMFSVKMENIDDLFYDKLVDPEVEILKIQTIINLYQHTMEHLYLSNNQNGMNRKAFQNLAKRIIGNEIIPATDEIFSCVTNLYEQENELVGKDTAMSASQFTGGIIRLANLQALMNDGMINTSQLANQTDKLLRSISI